MTAADSDTLSGLVSTDSQLLANDHRSDSVNEANAVYGPLLYTHRSSSLTTRRMIG